VKKFTLILPTLGLLRPIFAFSRFWPDIGANISGKAKARLTKFSTLVKP